MISLELNGVYLDFPEGIAISGEIFNSILSEEEEGVYTLPFSLPITPHNSKQLGAPELIQSRGKVIKDYSVLTLRLFGLPWKAGILRLRSVKGVYNCNFVADISAVAAYVANKKLSEVNYGGDRNLVPYPYIKLGLESDAGVGTVYANVSLPGGFINTSTYYDNINDTVQRIADGLKAHPNFYAAGFHDAFAEGSELQVSSETGIRPTWNSGYSQFKNTDLFQSDDVIKHMGSLLSDTYPYNDYVFFPLMNYFFNENNIDFTGRINQYWNGRFKRNDFASPLMNSIVPFPYLLYVIKAIFAEMNMAIGGNFCDDEEIKKVVIYNNCALDNLSKFSIIATLLINDYTKTLNVKNHVPDMLIGDFLKAVKSFFRLGMFFDSDGRKVEFKTLNSVLFETDEYDDWSHLAEQGTETEQSELDGVTLSFVKDGADAFTSERIQALDGLTIKDPVDTIADLPTSGNILNDVRLVINLNQYFKCQENFDDVNFALEWVFYSENLLPLVIGNGKTKMEIQGDTLTTWYKNEVDAGDPYDMKFLVPYAKQTGSSTAFDLGTNPFGLRLLFYRGMQQGYNNTGTPVSYPLGTPYKWDYDGNEIGKYCLSIDGESGLYNSFHKNYINLVNNTKYVTMIIHFDVKTFLNLRLDRKKRINGVTYLVQKISYNITQDGIKPATVRFMKV